MRVFIESISVADQDHALDFYTRILGFEIKDDIDMGGGSRWLTLASPDRRDGPLLLLEPNAGYPPMAALREALWRDGIASIMLEVDDIAQEITRLTELGVTFTVPLTDIDRAAFAVFDDTCGNLVNIIQHKN